MRLISFIFSGQEAAANFLELTVNQPAACALSSDTDFVNLAQHVAARKCFQGENSGCAVDIFNT